jgi:hypothetical protein
MNKKTIAGLISVLLVSVIVVTAFTPAFALPKGTEPTGAESLKALKETDRGSYYAFIAADLKATFPKTTVHDEYGNRTLIAYPQEFAGAYIDKSNTLHIVLTKNANSATKNNYQAILGYDKDVIYEFADFPLSHLYAVQSTLGDVMLQFGIDCTTINEVTNRVDVHLNTTIASEKEVIDYLNTKFNGFDSRCITFVSPAGINISADDTTSNALAGSNMDTAYTGGTLGFNAYRHPTGQAGVVTAAHLADNGVNCYNAKSTLIGTPSVRQFSGTLDAEFIPFSASITYSYKMHGFNSPDDCITHYYPDSSNYTNGMPINKYGRVSGANSGTVLSTSGWCLYNGQRFDDQLVISNTEELGDSGGPVFKTVVVSPGTDLHILAGIATFKDDSSNAYVSKVGNMISAWDITPFYGV